MPSTTSKALPVDDPGRADPRSQREREEPDAADDGGGAGVETVVRERDRSGRAARDSPAGSGARRVHGTSRGRRVLSGAAAGADALTGLVTHHEHAEGAGEPLRDAVRDGSGLAGLAVVGEDDRGDARPGRAAVDPSG